MQQEVVDEQGVSGFYSELDISNPNPKAGMAERMRSIVGMGMQSCQRKARSIGDLSDPVEHISEMGYNYGRLDVAHSVVYLSDLSRPSPPI